MPAATIVAAWISALIGVGPAIASGSQVCSGNCADLPTTPQSSSRVAIVAVRSEKSVVEHAVMLNDPASVAERRRCRTGSRRHRAG